MASEPLTATVRESARAVNLPAPTAWPIVLAFGVTLLFAGLVTSASVSILGAILAVGGSVGWFCDVLPVEKHESVPVLAEAPAVRTTRPTVARIEVGRPRISIGRDCRWRSIRFQRG